MAPRNYRTHGYERQIQPTCYPLFIKHGLMGISPPATFDWGWSSKLVRSIHIPIIFPPTLPFLLVKWGCFQGIFRNIEPSILSLFRKNSQKHRTWWFPEIGVPLDSIHFIGIFHEINHPFLGVPPWLWKPPFNLHQSPKFRCKGSSLTETGSAVSSGFSCWAVAMGGMHRFLADFCGENHKWGGYLGVSINGFISWKILLKCMITGGTTISGNPQVAKSTIYELWKSFHHEPNSTDGVYGFRFVGKLKTPPIPKQDLYFFVETATTWDISSYLNGHAQMVKCSPLTS